jgi:hypothetical protein
MWVMDIWKKNALLALKYCKLQVLDIVSASLLEKICINKAINKCSNQLAN